MELTIIPGGGITSPQGFTAGVAQAAIKKPGRYDMALVFSQEQASAAGVFTTNKFQAAPVIVSKEHLTNGMARGYAVNSGCANACTGSLGLEQARRMAYLAAEAMGCKEQEVFVASTGVIGVHLPMEKIEAGVKSAGKEMGKDKGSLAAQAIMTTDTFAKELAIQFKIGGKVVTMGAMAKGSGMIHPNMATLLGFVTTDAAIAPACLQAALTKAADQSFNMITVDGDTSTNDSLFILANGLAGNAMINSVDGDDYALFSESLTYLCIELAKMLAKDGEGATKLIEVVVENARTMEDARKGAKGIAGSALLKAAIFGEDANWGRVVCALGYSGANFNPDVVDVYLGGLKMAVDGGGLNFDEEIAAQILKEKTVVIRVDLKQGSEKATAWGCDLTYDYVKINGAYRT